ncbi:hypothetical protein FIBSPDRAFT_923744 [Athelia psychrophila]|uniref:DUF6533 domain-containing protein n=1 Tax=Athelia psychrophila TaxID=1759441 RepID=A0A166WWS2_9AGAM|nr:hypothetical protein FIBSPDRAFT_923744 [Fibularhizoctonia sp. CBS 109695]
MSGEDIDTINVWLSGQAQISAYVSIAVLAASVLDWLLSLDEEVEMCMRTGIRAPIVTYYLSRICTVAFVLFDCHSYFVMTAPYIHGLTLSTEPLVGSLFNMRLFCGPSEFWAMMALWWASCAFDSLLFFFRVRAVFSRSRTAQIVFAVLWALLGVAPIPFVYSGLYYGAHCMGVIATFKNCPAFSWFNFSMLLAAASYHTLIFVCISRELGKYTYDGKLNMRTLLTGDGLHAVAKSLLRSGQLYYMVTMGLLILQTVNIWAWDPNTWYASVTGLINQAVSCSLSYRVFRGVLLSERVLGPSMAEIRTADVEAMIMAVMVREEKADGT